MEINIDLSDVIKQFNEKEIEDKIKQFVKTMAFEAESSAKQTISDNSIDTGRFLNSIFIETWKDGDDHGFTMYDGVDYGIYHEFGVIKHWLPFFYYGDTSKPVLADWGRRVLGLTNDEMLAMGGIEVEIDETMPFRKALLHIESEAQETFNEIFED